MIACIEGRWRKNNGNSVKTKLDRFLMFLKGDFLGNLSDNPLS